MSYPVISVLSTSPAHCCPDRCWPQLPTYPKPHLPTIYQPLMMQRSTLACLSVKILILILIVFTAAKIFSATTSASVDSSRNRRFLLSDIILLLLLMYNLQWASGDARLVGLPSIKSFIFSARLLHHPRVSVKI